MHYFEDFVVGDVYDLGTTSASQEEMIAFAKQFDPQPFHTDPERAKNSAFGTLVASGAHTMALFLRLMVVNLLNDAISMGSPGLDEVRWRHPVHPDEVLHASFTVLETIPSKSRPDMGIVRSYCQLINASNETVFSFKGTNFLGRCP